MCVTAAASATGRANNFYHHRRCCNVNLFGMLGRKVDEIIESSVTRSLAQLSADTVIQLEVRSVVDEMVYDIESYEAATSTYDLKAQNRKLEQKIESLESSLEDTKNKLLKESQNLQLWQTEAQSMGQVLRSHLKSFWLEMRAKQELSKDLENAKDQIKEHTAVNHALKVAERELRDIQRQKNIDSLTKPLSSAPSSGSEQTYPVQEIKTFREKLTNIGCLEGDVLLRVLSFVGSADTAELFCLSRDWNRNLSAVFDIPDFEMKEKRTIVTLSPKNNVTTKQDRQMQRVNQLMSTMKASDLQVLQGLASQVGQLRMELAQVRTEREDLSAKLQGSESVKDFLMEKLKDVEAELASAKQETEHLTKKSASDYEIIGFIDARAQQMERSLVQYVAENKALQEKLNHAESTGMQSASVAHDMTQLIHAEKEELLIKSKTQRKILVKEVKSLRSENLKISSERDTLLRQLKLLKEAMRQVGV